MTVDHMESRTTWESAGNNRMSENAMWVFAWAATACQGVTRNISRLGAALLLTLVFGVTRSGLAEALP